MAGAGASQDPVTAELTRSEKIFSMVGTLLGLLLAALDQTIVATAGPEIQRKLAIAPSLYPWITTSYVVASTVLVPIWGKLSDRWGRKRVLLTGVSIFLLGSLLCGLAQGTTSLIVFRALQGVGSASLFTTAFAIVADLFPPAERGKWQGLFGAVFAISSVLGPLAGGVITETLGWHWVFFVNLPVGAIAVFMIATRMPPLRRVQEVGRIDVLGALALVVAVVPLLVALSLGHPASQVGRPGWAWGSWQILTMLGVSVAGIAAFFAAERRASDPILDLRLFRNRVFALGNLASFVVGSSFLSAFFFLPLYMENVVGVSATSSGLTTMPLTMGIVFGNVVVGQLVARIGRYKPILVASLCILVASFVLMGFTLSTESTQTEVTLKMIVVGLGMGPSIPLYTLAVQTSVPVQQIGVATSTATFTRSMGASIGIAIMGTVFAAGLPGGAGLSHEGVAAAAVPAGVAESLTAALSNVYRICIGIAAVGLLVTLVMPEVPLRQQPAGAAPPPPAE